MSNNYHYVKLRENIEKLNDASAYINSITDEIAHLERYLSSYSDSEINTDKLKIVIDSLVEAKKILNNSIHGVSAFIEESNQ